MDGTLFPCPDWRGRRDPWSVKHGCAGMSAQILVRLDGGLMWASDPYPGSMHDVAALDASGLLDGIDPSGWIADKGYIGRGMITPHKKPPNGELSEAAEEANKSINRIRQVVERTIAHIKSWRILHTDYR
ncbi:MAG: transposase family protein, partial [Actinomyces dentalis]